MKSLTGKQMAWWNAAALAVGLVPLALFWFFFARAPSLDVAKARARLAVADSGTALVDVRPAASYASNHVPGAIHWPYESISALSHSNDLPASLRGKTLLLMCESGLSSALAVNKLRSHGVGQVSHISGGMQAWLAHGQGSKSDLPFRPLSRFEQWLTVCIAFGLKPAYMMLSLALIIWLWRQRAADLAVLRWGLIWFWVGENGCTIDFLFFARGSDFWEYVHGYGMAVGFSLVVYALLEGFDQRLIKFSPEKERCAALSLCRNCFKYADAPCGLKRLFQAMIPVFALLSVMPLCARLNAASYDTTILGAVHNYCHLVSSQLFEWRFCAVLALALFTASWLVLMFKRCEPVAASKVLFAAAMGPLNFGLLRLFFFSTFTDNLMWFDVWEEITEFLFVLGTGVVLWVFRGALFTKQHFELDVTPPAATGKA